MMALWVLTERIVWLGAPDISDDALEKKDLPTAVNIVKRNKGFRLL